MNFQDVLREVYDGNNKLLRTSAANATVNIAGAWSDPKTFIGLVTSVSADKSTTPMVTSVSGSTTSATLLAANSARLGATFYNDSTAVLYLKLGATASPASFTVKMQSSDYYEVPAVHSGRVDGVWDGAAGSVKVTELT
jgi:hypothetical protein